MANFRGFNGDKDVASQARALAGMTLTFLGILVAIVLALIANMPRDDKRIAALEATLGPVVRAMLVENAYGLLSEVHISDLCGKPSSVTEELRDVRDRLNALRGFDRQNRLLETVLDAVVEMSSTDKAHSGDGLMRVDPLENVTLEATPREIGYLITFQGMTYLKWAREDVSWVEQSRYVELARRRFVKAAERYPGIANLWNGLAICLVDQSLATGRLDGIRLARDHFQLAFDLYRSPRNLGACINNRTYCDMVLALYDSGGTTSGSNHGEFVVSAPLVCEKISSSLREYLGDLDRAERGAPESVAILLSKAEIHCAIAILGRAAEQQPGETVRVLDSDPELDRAMELVREADSRGFTNWDYFRSKTWVKVTLLSSSAYREEMASVTGCRSRPAVTDRDADST